MGRGGGGARALAGPLPAPQAPPPPPHFLSRRRPRKLRRAGAEARAAARVPPTQSERRQDFFGAHTLGERPRLWSDGSVAVCASLQRSARAYQEVTPVARGTSAWPFRTEKPRRGHRLGRGLPCPARSIKRPLRDNSRPEAHGPGYVPRAPFPASFLARDPQEAPGRAQRAKGRIPLLNDPGVWHSQLPRGQILAFEMEYVK